ncbi:hypothetical protein [uncultured Amnibacterium sp.]|uniref:hypothetical protein n=1 Tax=uncultured Amnibacterium sp. TaxID=1631851 RepID=UPI0035CAF103
MTLVDDPGRRDRSRHRSASRFAVPRPAGPAAVLLPVVSLLPVIAATVVVQAFSPVAQRVPTGAARFDLAAAWVATQPGALAGTTSWLTAPTLGRAQLGLLIRLLQGGQAQSVLAAAHGAMLLIAVLQVGLLWWALRRLGVGGVAAGLGAAVLGIAPIAIDTHAAVSGTAVGVVWLLLAAPLALGRPRPVALVGSGIAAAIAAASAPVLLAAVLPLGVLLVLRLLRERRRRDAAARWRLVALGVGFGGAAAALAGAAAAAAALPRTSATASLEALVAAQGPVASIGAAGFAHWLAIDPLLLVVAVLACGIVAIGPREVPVLVLVAVLAAVAVWPLGADATTSLVLLLPAVAAVVARSADVGLTQLRHPLFVRSVLGSGWLTGIGAVLVVAVVGWLVGLGGLVRGADQPIARAERWVGTSVPAGQTVLVGLGAWPDLAASSRADVGWWAAREGATAVASSVPWRDADYVVTDDSLPPDRSGAADRVLDRSLEVAAFGTGATAMAVRAVEAPPTGPVVRPPTSAAGRAAAALRRTVGRQLAENPRIEVDGPGRAHLLAGAVDSRIAVVLAQFVTQHRIAVAGFGLAKGDDSGVLTTVTISEIDGRGVPADGSRTGVLLRFLSDLQGDYATESIDATDDGITAAFAPDPDLSPSG